MNDNTSVPNSQRKWRWLLFAFVLVLSLLIVLYVQFDRYIRAPEPRQRVLDMASLEQLKVGQHYDEVVRILKMPPGDYSRYSNGVTNPPLLSIGEPNESKTQMKEWYDDAIHLWINFDSKNHLVTANAGTRSIGTWRAKIRQFRYGFKVEP